MIKKITTSLLATTLVATSVFAQDGMRPPLGEGRPPLPPRGEMRKEIYQEIKEVRGEKRDDRQENRQEFRGEAKEAMGEFKEGMKERREWMMNNASGTASGTRPTPFKDLREDMKDARKDFKEGAKDMRDKMKDEMKKMLPPRMATLTDTQSAAIAAKLGISVEALNAQLASGTKLKELVKDKITPEDMKNILPPRVASITRAIEERGFLNNFRARLFGPREEKVEQVQNEFGEVEEVVKPIPGVGFFRRLFNW